MIHILTHPNLELDDQHLYTVAGREVPSVTQILQASKLANFDDIPIYLREWALARGRKTHDAILFWLQGILRGAQIYKGVVKGNPKFLSADTIGCLESLNKFLNHSDFQIEKDVRGQMMLERMVYHPHYKFAGRFDVVGRFPRRGLALGDWKRGVLRGVEYQTAAYLLCVPNVFERFALKLRPDGKIAKPHFYEALDLPYHQYVFLSELAKLREQQRELQECQKT